MEEIKKKYAFTGRTMLFEGRKLKQIYYVRNVSIFAKTGDIGGWIEHEGNLSHDGDCIVLQHAKVFGNAKVMGNAKIIENAIVKDNAILKDDSLLTDDSIVGSDTIVGGEVLIIGSSVVNFFEINTSNDGHIMGSSVISDSKIEATGIILNTKVHKSTLSGSLSLIDEDEICVKNISY